MIVRMNIWQQYLVASLLIFSFQLQAKTLDINAMTFNLRVPVDPTPNDWASRSPRVIAIIQRQQPDFLGIQESTPQQVNDLQKALGAYAYIGRGRETDSGGEGTQIFYRKDRWHLDKTDQGTLQLSPTPEVPGSNGWGMRWPRIFTWAHLREKKSGRFVYVFNTHFPLEPQERDLSVKLVAQHILARKHQKDSVILTGDFNACESEKSMMYLKGKDDSPITMQDTFRVLHPENKEATFHAFGKSNDACKIDYIYTLGKFDVLRADIIKDPEGAGFASDHYAVSASIRLQR